MISAGQSTVEGLAIVGFSGSAIVVDSPGGDVIAGELPGVDRRGGTGEPNGTGITVSASSTNTIGGRPAWAT